MRAYRRLTTLFAFLLAAALFCGAGLAPGWAAHCSMAMHGQSCVFMNAKANAGECPMSEHAKSMSNMPCCRKHAVLANRSQPAISAPLCHTILSAAPTLPAAWQNAGAPQIAPPAFDLFVSYSALSAPVSLLQEIRLRRGPPRAGPVVPSPTLLTPSLRAPPV